MQSKILYFVLKYQRCISAEGDITGAVDQDVLWREVSAVRGVQLEPYLCITALAVVYLHKQVYDAAQSMSTMQYRKDGHVFLRTNVLESYLIRTALALLYSLLLKLCKVKDYISY